jgi:hypothetical protein
MSRSSDHRTDNFTGNTLKRKSGKLPRISSVCFKNNWFHYFVFPLLFLLPLSSPECNLICCDSEFYRLCSTVEKVFNIGLTWRHCKSQEGQCLLFTFYFLLFFYIFPVGTFAEGFLFLERGVTLFCSVWPIN